MEAAAKGDWISMCIENLKELKINETLEEIGEMFKKLLNISNKQTRYQRT